MSVDLLVYSLCAYTRNLIHLQAGSLAIDVPWRLDSDDVPERLAWLIATPGCARPAVQAAALNQTLSR